MSHELEYTSQAFEKKVIVRAKGEVAIELQDDQKIRGNIPLTSPIPGILTAGEAAVIKEELTLRLAEAKGWNTRRLLSKPFEDGDQEMKFMYILSDPLLRKTIEAGKFTPVYLKDLDTRDIRG